MFRPRTIQWLALICGAGLVAVASTRIAAINRGRAALNIMGSESPVANTPPAYVFYIQAFGAFRGLIADVLRRPHQTVILPDMKAGCSMADMATAEDVEEAWDRLTAVHGDTLVPITPQMSS